MEEGYYANINQSLPGKPLVKPIVEQGNSKLIYDLLKKDLRKYFNGDYYNDVAKTETRYRLAIAATGTNRITVQYSDLNGRYLTGEDYCAGTSQTLEFTDVGVKKSGQDLINWFKNTGYWVPRKQGRCWLRT